MVKVEQDLTGKTFGRWTVIKQAEDYISPSGIRQARWHCQCSCKNKTERDIATNNLIKGISKSCGCLQKEKISKITKKYNTYDLSGEYGIGYTSKGEEFYFDLEDYDKIKSYCWYVNSHGYLAARRLNEYRTVLFHRLIFNEPDELNYVIDHINHNKLNNRKYNLRICTQQQNSMNKKNVKNNTSGVIGVTYHKRDKVWQASIRYKGKFIYLGSFDNFDDAVKARKEAEIKYFGEYRYKNN